MSTEFYYTRIRDVKPPSRGTKESAGIDFYVPNDFVECVVPPKGSILIPSGLKCAFDKGYALVFFNKSGVASKRMLVALGCVFDSDYHGEMFISMGNVGSEPQTIRAGEKISQFLLLPVEVAEPIEVNQESELLEKWSSMRDGGTSERGEGGFGSTGTN